MKTSKIYYLKMASGEIWCYGYYNGINWRIFDASPVINRWFNWRGLDPISSGLFHEEGYTKVNNFKEKAKC